MHSYILNINDDKWKEGFEEADQDEIKESSGNGFKNPLPANVLNLLQKINKKVCKHNFNYISNTHFPYNSIIRSPLRTFIRLIKILM
jgi:hypothetical protein